MAWYSILRNGGTYIIAENPWVIVGELIFFIILALTGLAKAILVIIKSLHEGRSGANSHKRSKDVAETTNAK